MPARSRDLGAADQASWRHCVPGRWCSVFGRTQRGQDIRDCSIAAALPVACAQRAPAPLTGGALQEVVFDRYSPLARNEEIARRTLTPLTLSTPISPA